MKIDLARKIMHFVELNYDQIAASTGAEKAPESGPVSGKKRDKKAAQKVEEKHRP